MLALVTLAGRLGASLRARPNALVHRLGPRLELLPAYVIGGVAMYRVIERATGF